MASLMPNGRQQYTDPKTGLALAHGTLSTFQPGTRSPKLTWADAGQTAENPTAIPLDAMGSASVFWDGVYDIELRNKSGALVYTQSKVASLLSSDAVSGPGGSNIIGFIASGAGAVQRSQQDKDRDTVSVQDYGPVTTSADAAVSAAKNALSAGGTLHFPAANYTLSSDHSLFITDSGLTLSGDGASTVLTAASAANITSVIAIAGSNITIRDLVIDGNRADGGINPVNFGIVIAGSNIHLENVEVKNCPGVGVFIGSSTATPSNITFTNCWIHDNGGVTVPGRASGNPLAPGDGIGVGIQGGGTFLPDDIRILGCRFERNYNTVTRPGDSAAINITGTNIQVSNNFFEDNFNVGGGQVALASDAAAGSADGDFIVTGNIFDLTTTFGGDATCGPEIDGRKFVVANNIVKNASADGVRVESSAGDGVVSGNIITCVGVGVNLLASGGAGIERTIVSNNQILEAGVGIQIQPGGGVASLILQDNYINPAIAVSIAGPENATLIRGNFVHNPPIQTSLTTGASPYAWPLLNYDAVYVCQLFNGLTAANVDGVNVSPNAGIPVPIKAGHQFTVIWTGSAPTFGIYPQQ